MKACATGIFSAMLAFSSTGLTGGQHETSGENPGGRTSMRANMVEHGGNPAGMEFSSDGRCVLCWWLPQPPVGEYDKILGKCVVFDLMGAVVPSATGPSGHLAPQYVTRFPTTASRQRFAWFLADTNTGSVCLWGFSTDYSLGFRFLKPEGYSLPGDGELWRLSPSPERRWSMRLPEDISRRGLAGFFETAGSQRLLVAFMGMSAYVLSTDDGTLLDSFVYGSSPRQVKEPSRNQFSGLPPAQRAPIPDFLAGVLSFDSSRSLLACGADEGKRIRVLSVNPPHCAVFEAHVGENPRRPRGGLWSVDSLDFSGGGRYLVAGYKFGGRATKKSLSMVEIFDTSSWRTVWSTEDTAISPVVAPKVSPDARTLALLRGHWLEISPFASGASDRR